MKREDIVLSRGNLVREMDYAKISDVLNNEAIGLVPAIVQDAITRDVLMLAYMNADALEKTLVTGMATFWTRSRQKLWTKGEESGNFMKLAGVSADCDLDTLLLQVNPQGDRRACHTGEVSCFYRGIRLG